MAEELWYYEKDGEQHGPVTQVELQALIEIGEISRDNLAWKPGEREWTETGTFEVLLPSFQTPPPMRAASSPAPPPGSPPPVPVPATAPLSGVPSAAAAPVAGTQERQSPASLATAPTQALVPAPAQPVGEDGEALTAEIVPPETLPDLPPIPQVPASQLPVPQVPAPPVRQTQHVPTVRVEKSLFDWISAYVVLFANLKFLLTTGVTVVVIAAGFWWWMKNNDRPPHPSQEALHGTVVPVGYKGPVGQIKIDAYPWAELTGLSRSGEKLEVPGTAITPLVLLVEPGSYRVELGAYSCELDIAEEATKTCSQVVKTIDAATYYREVGW